MSLGPWEICIPTASGWSRMRREIYKLEQCRMPRYSRVPYHQKGTRTHDLRQTTFTIMRGDIIMAPNLREGVQENFACGSIKPLDAKDRLIPGALIRDEPLTSGING